LGKGERLRIGKRGWVKGVKKGQVKDGKLGGGLKVGEKGMG
jgi:hypothetical protein